MSMPNVIDYESGELDEAGQIVMFQQMINNGQAWHLQGSYGRAAMDLIESGQCVLGREGCRDYWGNYVPGRDEVEPGTKGSLEYAAELYGAEHAEMLDEVGE